MDDGALRARLDANFALLERFARALQAIARQDHGARPELARYLQADADRTGSSRRGRRPAARRRRVSEFRPEVRLTGGNYSDRVAGQRN